MIIVFAQVSLLHVIPQPMLNFNLFVPCMSYIYGSLPRTLLPHAVGDTNSFICRFVCLCPIDCRAEIILFVVAAAFKLLHALFIIVVIVLLWIVFCLVVRSRLFAECCAVFVVSAAPNNPSLFRQILVAYNCYGRRLRLFSNNKI